VAVAEVLYQRKMVSACDVVIKLGFEAQDLADADRAQLHLLVALQQLDAGDERSAGKAIKEALKLDRNTRLPRFASPRAAELLEDARALLPTVPRQPPPASVTRESPGGPLCRAVDAMYRYSQFDAADVVLDFADNQPLSKEERAQIMLRRGILRVEADQEERARSFFQSALELDQRARLPEYAPPRALRAFEDIRIKMAGDAPIARANKATGPKPPPSAGQSPASPSDPTLDLRNGLLIGGGAALGVGAVVFIASSAQTPQNQTGQVIGGVVGGVGVAVLVGALVLTVRPEVLQMRVTVAPANQGGMLLATGHF